MYFSAGITFLLQTNSLRPISLFAKLIVAARRLIALLQASWDTFDDIAVPHKPETPHTVALGPPLLEHEPP